MNFCMQVITSKDNEKVKYIKKLKEKKYRDENGKFLVEGIKMLEEALKENADIDTIIICEECIKREVLDTKFLYEIADKECIYVTEKIFNSLTDVVNPQGILAVINKSKKAKEIKYNEDFILVLDNIQDPGNMGTILRTLDSINISQIVISKNSTDVYNPKVIRSTMGAIFRVNIIVSDNLVDTIEEIKKQKYKVLATSLKGAKNIYDINFKKTAVVIGNEANGVSNEVLEKVDTHIKIPMLGRTESLNASVAASVIMYEYVRQTISK